MSHFLLFFLFCARFGPLELFCNPGKSYKMRTFFNAALHIDRILYQKMEAMLTLRTCPILGFVSATVCPRTGLPTNAEPYKESGRPKITQKGGTITVQPMWCLDRNPARFQFLAGFGPTDCLPLLAACWNYRSLLTVLSLILCQLSPTKVTTTATS